MQGQDIESKIQKILWGKSIIDIADGVGHPNSFILRSLTISEANYAQYIYDKELQDSLYEGLLLHNDLVELYNEQGVWTETDDAKIEELIRQTKVLKTQIKNYQFVTVKRERVKKQLKKVEEEISRLKEEKESLLLVSAEVRAEEIKRRYTIMLSTESMDETRIWNNEKEFLHCEDQILIFNLAKAYINNNIFDTAVLREIARNPSWRFRWSAAKNGADLFGKPISNWSEMQNMLVYWSQYYDQVYECTDRPPEAIIQDDDACDAWFEEQSKKYSTSTSSNSDKNMFGTKRASRKKDHTEQFVMVQPGDKQAVREVQNMNAPSVRDRLRKEYEVIKKSKGRVKEWDLRGKKQ